MAADTLDVITLAEAHAAINLAISVTAQDTEIEQFVTAVSRRLDALCGPIVARTNSNELHDGGGRYGGWSRYGGYGRCFIRPRRTPVLSIVTLVEYNSTTPTTLTEETNASKPANAYLLETDGKHNVKIIRRSGNSDALFADGRRNVELTYRPGRALTTALVDRQFKEAAALTLQHLWNNSAGSWTRTPDFGAAVETQPPGMPPWDVPAAAKKLIADQLIGPHVA